MASNGGPTFGERLRRLREAAGLTQEELAERAGLSPRGVASLERGDRQRPYPHTVRALVEALRLSEGDRAALVSLVPPRTRPLGDPETARSGGAPLGRLEGSAPGGLPGHLTALIGREAEAAVVLGLMARPDVRLLTLTGPGGVGKTRLALGAAASARAPGGAFPDGVIFVPLAPLRDAAQVQGAIAAALGASDAGLPGTTRLALVLRQKRLLLVLDNCEHVADAAPAVADLLVACPALTVLATSRVALRVAGEQEYRVPPLGLPGRGEARVAALLRAPAVELFVARAQAVQPGFQLTEANAGAVAAICRRLAGLPLAIELAAARTALLPPSALLRRLENDLGVLAGGPRNVPERQQTMRAAIAWSHDLLGPAEQALFRRMAVFAGGATLTAVEQVCGEIGSDGEGESEGAAASTAAHAGAGILEDVATLLRSSLLERIDGDLWAGDATEGGEGAEGAADPSVRLLEPIRDYARERLQASGELAALRRRHAAYYQALAAEAGARLAGPGQIAWLDRLVRDEYNVRAAVRSLLDLEEAERAVDLVWALWRYWRFHAQGRDARRWAEEALGGGHGPLTERGRARALVTAGMAWSDEEAPSARATLEEGLRRCRAAGERRGEALALLLLGLLTLDAGDARRAVAQFEESVVLFRAVGEEWGAAFALINSGIPALREGQYENAERRFGEGLAAARTAGDGGAVHRALYSLGVLARARGDQDGAVEHFAQGLTLARELRDRLNAGYFVHGLAQVAAERGRASQAVRLLGTAGAVLDGAGAPLYRYGVEGPWHERALTAARAALGEAGFAAAGAQGRSQPLDAAIDEVLALAALLKQ